MLAGGSVEGYVATPTRGARSSGAARLRHHGRVCGNTLMLARMPFNGTVRPGLDVNFDRVVRADLG